MTERRVMKKLDSLVANRQLSRQGLDWLMCALDPFHDTEQTCAGYPDISSAKSIVQTITKTANFSVPASAGLGAWDAHIFFLPVSTIMSANANNFLLRSTSDSLGNLLSNMAPPALYPGINVISGASGAPWTDASSTVTAALRLSEEFANGQYRILGCGWEIVDTSPVVYKQGSLTAYRAPTTSVQGYYAKPPGIPRSPAVYSTLPPISQAEAVLYPNSRTWQASEGCYQIATLNEQENAYVNPVPSVPIFKNAQTLAQITATIPTICFLPVFNDNLAPGVAQPLLGSDVVRSNATVLPWDITGTFLAGLNNLGTFQVTVKYFVEKVPTLSDPNLLVLAKTPTPADPVVIEIYSKACQELPVAVPVGENPLGEWFDKVMEVISNILPVVGEGLSFIPGAQLVGKGLGAGAKALGEFNKSQRQNQPNTTKLTKPQAVALAQNGAQVKTVSKTPQKKQRKIKS